MSGTADSCKKQQKIFFRATACYGWKYLNLAEMLPTECHAAEANHG